MRDLILYTTQSGSARSRMRSSLAASAAGLGAGVLGSRGVSPGSGCQDGRPEQAA
jgi:hypothetical protein